MRFSWPIFAKKSTSSQDAFTRIYEDNEWLFGSGEGSLPGTTKTYRAFLQRFLAERNVTSVVDIGCGDWQFSRLIDWSGIAYTGIDVVPRVIQRNIEEFANGHIRFRCQDALRIPPPRADLLLLKDVVQHWSFADIASALPWFGRYNMVLVTNDIAPEDPVDIPTGSYRPIDLRRPPFSLSAEEVCRWSGIFSHNTIPWTKVTLLITPNPLRHPSSPGA